jgi:apolipoprotein N-acyltransferase
VIAGHRAIDQTLRLAFHPIFSKLAPLKKSLAQLADKYRILLAALAGLVLALAFPNYNIAGLAWIAPALILACASRKTPRQAFAIGYVAGFAFWLATLTWLLEIPVAGFPILGWIALSAFLALYIAAWVWFMSRITDQETWSQRFRFSLLGAAAWVTMEMLRARILTGFPWDNIGSSQWQLTPLIQIASVTGVYGVSFLVVWTSLALLSAMRLLIRQPTERYVWMRELVLPIFVVIGLFTHGMSRMRNKTEAESTLRVTFVQPAVPQTMIWDSSANSNRFQNLLALTETSLTNKTDLLLWPEAALPELTDETIATITNLIRRHSVWMMFNGDYVTDKPDAAPGQSLDVFNSAFLFNPAGDFVGTYHKRQLVIFGEYVPLADALPFVKWLTPITGSYTRGKTITRFPVDRFVAVPLICFEDTFPHHVRDHVNADTDFMVNLTNDGWFGEKAAQWQHVSSAAFRAVENGVPLLRSCNTGVTCWIDEHGRMREILRDKSGSEYAPGVVTWEIPIQENGSRVQTYYNRHGDQFGWICVAITGFVLLKRMKRANKKPVAS